MSLKLGLFCHPEKSLSTKVLFFYDDSNQRKFPNHKKRNGTLFQKGPWAQARSHQRAERLSHVSRFTSTRHVQGHVFSRRPVSVQKVQTSDPRWTDSVLETNTTGTGSELFLLAPNPQGRCWAIIQEPKSRGIQGRLIHDPGSAPEPRAVVMDPSMVSGPRESLVPAEPGSRGDWFPLRPRITSRCGPQITQGFTGAATVKKRPSATICFVF